MEGIEMSITLILEIVKNIIGSIYQKIGAWGCIGLILLSIIFWQHHELSNDTITINDIRSTNAVLTNDIKTQDDAIHLANKQRDSIQTALDKTITHNNELAVTVAAQIATLNSLPEAKTCDSSIAEIGKIAKKVADEWNIGVIQ